MSLGGVFIKTYGCQANVYDSDRLVDLLHVHGYGLVNTPNEADIIVLNTCHIREKATEKVFSELGRLSSIKASRIEQGKMCCIVVMGCVAQAEGEELVRRASYVDIVIGPQSYHRLPEHIEKMRRQSEETGKVFKKVDTEFPIEPKFDFLPVEPRDNTVSAFLSIQEGCDKFCTFCCVPYTRGAEYSRPLKDIVREAKQQASRGVKEITLLGQNVNAYHGDNDRGCSSDLAELCLRVADIEGIERIRYTTSHPRDMSESLLHAHKTCSKLMPFIHLPVQSGSDKMLSSMNRRHSVEMYKRIIDDFKEAMPHVAFSSDFIVGFPGETEDDFEKTLELVEYVKYSQAFSFKYSPRSGTPAAAMSMQVPENIKTSRLARLQQLLFDHQIAFNHSFVGQYVPVLFEKEGRGSQQYTGKSPYMQSVVVSSEKDVRGMVLPVRVDRSSSHTLYGSLARTDYAYIESTC